MVDHRGLGLSENEITKTAAVTKINPMMAQVSDGP